MFPDKIAWRPLLAAILLATLSVHPADAGNTTCASKQLDWYSIVVGESPCMTYQRLRQICNNDYQVPSFQSAVPGDRCDDQVSACCCNTIAFQLSMLCLICQQDHQDNGGIGTDAPKGSFDVYRTTATQSCPPAKNFTLPDNVQRAVCNENIRIDNFLYGGWEDGSWFYVWTENAELDHASNNNDTFTHCPNHTSMSTTATSTANARSTVTAAMSMKSTSHGALIGGVVGGVLGLTIIVLAGLLWMRRRTHGKGGQWSRNSRFRYTYSATQASGSTPNDSPGPSTFTTAGPFSSQSSYSAFSSSGTGATAPGTCSARRNDEGSLHRHSRSYSGLFSDTYNTSGDGDRATEHTRPRSGPAPSVSLSAFDFMGSQIHDDGRAMRSFPLSDATDGHSRAD